MLWAGTDDGRVNLTRDEGAHWSDVTPKGLPEWSTISMVEPSPHDARVAYVAVDRHKLDDIRPYAWKTTDSGANWTPIAAGLPEGAIVHVVREDPERRGLLYAGTEIGVFVSFDDGATWRPLQFNLPTTPIHDLVVKGSDLVAATHGRSFWILDDVTPLRQVGGGTAGMVLYTPETAVRLHYPDEVDSRHPVGENPPAGAIIDYVLPAASTGELTLDVVDGGGKVVRHLSSTTTTKEIQPPEWPDQIVPNDLIPAKAGMNRLVWDLRMNDPAQIPGAFYSGTQPRGPVVPPGRYELRLTANGATRTAPLLVIADPRVPGSNAAIAEKTALAVATVADIDALHQAVNEIRMARKSLAGRAALAALDGRLVHVEEALMQVNMKGSEANLAFPGMLNEQYATFAATLDDADTPPTAQHRAMFEALHRRLTEQLAAWRRLRDEVQRLPKPLRAQQRENL